MLALRKLMFSVIAAIQINEKYCKIYLIELTCKLAMHCMMDRNADMLVRDHYYWMGILMMLVSKKTTKII